MAVVWHLWRSKINSNNNTSTFSMHKLVDVVVASLVIGLKLHHAGDDDDVDEEPLICIFNKKNFFEIHYLSFWPFSFCSFYDLKFTFFWKIVSTNLIIFARIWFMAQMKCFYWFSGLNVEPLSDKFRTIFSASNAADEFLNHFKQS